MTDIRIIKLCELLAQLAVHIPDEPEAQELWGRIEETCEDLAG